MSHHDDDHNHGDTGTSWFPDEVVPEALIAGRVNYRNIDRGDVLYAVALWTHQGYSVTEISGWLRCSTRQVKRFRADLVGQVLRRIIETRDATTEQASTLRDLQRENDRLRDRRDRLEHDARVRAGLCTREHSAPPGMMIGV